jgi:recombinational DNA repair protein RecR
MADDLKNEFRDEVKKESVSEQDMIARDQRATYLFLKHQKAMFADDVQRFQNALERAKAFGNDVFKLPDCVSRTDMLAQNKAHIEQLEKQIANCHLPRAQEVILALLEDTFGEETMEVKGVMPEDD